MQPFTKNNLFIAACYAATLALGMFLGPKFSKENSNSRNGAFIPFSSSRDTKIEQVLKLINEKYVDPVKTDSLEHFAINEILERLDPHSHYLSPKEAAYLDEDLEGHFDGIGIEYFILNDTLLVTHVISDAPAFKAGVNSGDKIIRVDKKNIAGTGISAAEAAKLLRGKKGTSVRLLLKPMDGGAEREVSVKRAQISVSSVDAAYMLDQERGYIKISRFGAATHSDFKAALSRLRSKGMKSLVLDLRENGGGYLNAAAELADEFLPDRKLIVYTKGQHEPRTDYYAAVKGHFENGKLAILVDENTASASEIVAGAVQDLDRGIIVGRRTFGKGLVQEQFNFSDGSVLNLTVARYYTPSGRSIQRPYENGAGDYYHDILNRSADSTARKKTQGSGFPAGDQTFKTASGRLMYGGGGITPDLYVAADTSGYNSFYYQISDKGILQDYLFTHLVKNEKPSKDDFLNYFKISEQQYSELVSASRFKGIKAGREVIDAARPILKQELKALLGRYYFGDEMFFKVLNSSDKTIQRSVEALKQ